MDIAFELKLTTYLITAIYAVIFAIIGFSYNARRMEISVENNSIQNSLIRNFKTACQP